MVHLEYKKQRINNLSKNILLNQMKHSIIKSYAVWLNESLAVQEAETPGDPTTLFKKQDRAGLVALAQSKDSEQVKSHPAYAAVMEWWKQGQGDLNLIKSILKRPKAKKADRKHSLESIYSWASGGAKGTGDEKIAAFYAAADSIVRNSDKLVKLGVDSAKIASLKDAVAKLKESSAKEGMTLFAGFDKLLPAALVDNKFSTDKGTVAVSSELDKPEPKPALVKVLLSKRWTQDPKAGIDELEKIKIDPANVNKFWKASSTLDDAAKIELLNLFQQKATTYIAKQQKAGKTLTLTDAIKIASDLYIVPKGQMISITFDSEAETPPQPEPLHFSYPEDPNGNEASEEFKKGLSMFPDNGITVTPEALAGIQSTVKNAVDAVKAAGGEITAVKTWGYSSTSKVSTNYKSASGTGNEALAKDRLASINKALADSIAAAGITITPTVDAESNLADPNRGPEWTDAQRTDTAKWGTPGARTKEYEDTYGKWRFASAFFTIEYKIVPKVEPFPVAGTPTPSGKWDGLINWQDEGFKFPPIRIPGGGKPKTKKPRTKRSKTACPVFD